MGGCAMSSIRDKVSPRRSGKKKTESPESSKGSGHQRSGGRAAEESAEAIRSAFLSGQLQLDNRCPLDERQLYCITKSWKAINRNMSVTAINMFVRLFETNHDIQEMFTSFKDVQSIADLRNSKVLEGHALKVFCTIDDAIVNFDDMDYVLKMLQIVAQFHAQRLTNFDQAFFLRVEEPFILAVKEELGDRFTLSIENTYRATIRFIVGTLAKEFVASRQMMADGNRNTRLSGSPGGVGTPARQISNGV